MIVDPRLTHRKVQWRYAGAWAVGYETYETWKARSHRRFNHFKLRQWLRTMTGYVVGQDRHLWYLFPVGLTLHPLALPPPVDLTHLKEPT